MKKLIPFNRICLLAAILFVCMVGQARAALPPEAQEAVKKGLLAAKEQEWDIAIQSFQEARKTAPDAPEIFGYLGMAESKIPGRELRAIAWFGAYLAASPRAPNAAAVKEEIAGLQIKSEGNINRMIRTVQEAGSVLPDTPIRHDGGISGNITNTADQGRMMALNDGANLWAAAGNAAEAIQIAHSKGAAGYNDSYLLSQIVTTLASEGFIADAIKTAASFYDVNYSMAAQLSIAQAQANSGEMTDARATLAAAQGNAAATQSIYLKNSQLLDVAKAQVKIGDMAGAQKSADLIPSADQKSWAELVIAMAQVDAGDRAGAQASLSKSQIDADRWIASSATQKAVMCDCLLDPHDEGHLASRELLVGQTQTKAGDVAHARATLLAAQKYAGRIADASARSQNAYNISMAQVEAGDIQGAQTTAEFITDAFWKNSAALSIAQAQARAGDIAGARETAKLITDVNSRQIVEYAIQAAELKARAAAASRANPSANDEARTDALPLPRAAATPPSPPIISVADWTRELHSLNSLMFLDIAGALKTPQRTYKTIFPGSSGFDDSNNDPKKAFQAMLWIANAVVKAKNNIDLMLKQQFKKQTKP
jgi:hypothetical protein